MIRLPFAFVWLITFSAGVTTNALGQTTPASIDFNKQVRPILTQYCSACHGGVKQAGDLSFVYAEQVLPPDGWVIEPGDPESSVLIERIKSADPDQRMPPPDEHPDPLPAEKVVILAAWIAQGAKWGDLWSMAPLERESTPPQSASEWPRQPLDEHVHARLASNDLAPSSDAPPQEWLRRVSFDLTGLPPSIDHLKTFTDGCESATDTSAVDALYASEVERLLNNQHFGERWASVWMDLARYADSKGFEKDPHRDMWPYRDWLINAFNQDLPYDEFTIRQLAGDLLADPTPDDLIATAFHRNTQTNTEGGTDDEEFRVAAVIDRINTTWTVWQATTFGCVQCHSHPYDPFKHDEYYSCMAIMNDTLDADLATDYPTLKIPEDRSLVPAAIAAQQKYQSVREARNQLGSQLAHDMRWKPIAPSKVASSEGQLKIDGDRVRAAGGTFPTGVRYTFEADAKAMTALRIEIAPATDNPAEWPEQGSVLSHLQVSLIGPDEERSSVAISDVFVDALTGTEDPRSSLNKSKEGVGGYPKLHRPRWAVFVLKQRLKSAPDSVLQIEMLQSNSVAGNLATPIRNFQWSSTDADAWTELLDAKPLQQATKALSDAKRVVDRIKGAALPVVARRPEQVRRSTRQFIRGNWLDRGDEISPGIPAVFGADALVRDRLDFARWLVSDQNPLAARVWANRIWAQLFGLGLVETLEDFGSSGTLPIDAVLLDHLATRLRDQHQWRLKPMLKEIVLSSSYRQTNIVSAELLAQDPRNRLISRGPRTRLTAEMIRDQSLSISGLLHDRLGGPSVMPAQPDGVWQTVYNGAQWKTPEGEQRFRRALYTYWRRTSPYPSFLMFDSPTRDLCSARRIATNTPLQALVTLNDPVYVECAQALAKRSLNTIGSNEANLTAAIEWIYRSATQRMASEKELQELTQLYVDLQTEEPNRIDLPTLSIVANTILNLDRALTK
ncbi:MAG: PSD1 and planctomycete cytochrome C domain-containing protein [Rubripirellula sp.]